MKMKLLIQLATISFALFVHISAAQAEAGARSLSVDYRVTFTATSTLHNVEARAEARKSSPKQPTLDIDEHSEDRHQGCQRRCHQADPLKRRVGRIDVALHESVRNDRLSTSDVRPTAAKRVSCNLRHGKELHQLQVQVGERSCREIRDDVVVEDRRKECRECELNPCDVRRTDGFDAILQ